MLQLYFLGLALNTFFSFLLSTEQQQQPKTSFGDKSVNMRLEQDQNWELAKQNNRRQVTSDVNKYKIINSWKK